MATATDVPQGPFRLRQLIYDTRYRSLTIQAIAFILLMLGLSWLVTNTIGNLSALGKDFNFGYLTDRRAGYDINQMLIPYSADDTHARAALVGILNTLLVSALGIVLATIFGVIAGVLRLSSNWIVARLMTFYVEGFRNIPLLLWILLIFAVMTESTPQPRDFRPDPDTGLSAANMLLWDSVAISNRGVFIPAPVFGPGSGLVVAVFLLSVAGAFLWRRHARRELYDKGRDLPVLWPVVAILILPALIAYVLTGRPIGLDLPALAGFNFSGGWQIRNSLLALWLALSLYTGAFIAENVRGGILAVSRGQSEAAYALGLRPGRTMSLVILPQAMRVIIPPMISQYLNLIKNSSLAIAVGYMDVRSTLGGISINQTGRELEGMLLLGLFYLAISLIVSGLMNLLNARLRLKER